MRRSSPGQDAGHLRADQIPQLAMGLEPTWIESHHGGLAASLRASGSTARPSENGQISEIRMKSEHGRKSVTWAGADDENRNLLRSSRSEGILVRPKKRTESPAPAVQPPVQSEHELHTQLNLLRERSWTEQQSLRKQLEDSKIAHERSRKELEHANVQIQQLRNETQDLHDRVSAVGGIAQDATASQLFEEKNAQIRHLESLVKELTSSQTISVGTVRPSSGKLRQKDERSQELQAQLDALRAERIKEQEDLRELEQVVPVFEAKMATIKQENKDLKRTVAELRQRIAVSEEAGHQIVPLASSQERRLQSINENLSRRILESTIRQNDFRCLLDAMNQWRSNPTKTARNKGSHFGDAHEELNSLSDQNVSLRFQLEKSGKEVSSLKEEMESMKATYVNMLESERTQSAVMAQRMMKVEDVESTLRTEEVELRKANKALKEQLEACKRRLEYLDGERRVSESGTEDDKVERLEARVLGLHDDVASLTALRSAAVQRLELVREVGIMRTVKHKREASLLRVLHAWRMLPAATLHTEGTAMRARAAKDKRLALQALQGWAIEASFVSKAEVAERAQQLEAVKSTVAALQEGKVAQMREAEAQGRANEELRTSLCLREQDVETLRVQAAAAQKGLLAAKAKAGGVESALGGVVEELRAARAAVEGLEEEQRGAEAARREAEGKVERLMAEREGWLKEQSRVRQRQGGGAGGPVPQAEVQAAMMAERCRVMAHRVDVAEAEKARAEAAAGSVEAVRAGLQEAVATLSAQAGALGVRPPVQAKALRGGGGAAQALDLVREVGVVSRALAEAAREAQGKLDRVLSEGPVVGQRTEGGEAREQELKGLRAQAQRMREAAEESAAEAARVRGEMGREAEAAEQRVGALAAALAVSQAEGKYLQDMADGSAAESAFAQTLRGLEKELAALHQRLGAKSAECHRLQRHLNAVAVEGQRALTEALADNNALRQRLNGGPGDASVVPPGHVAGHVTSHGAAAPSSTVSPGIDGGNERWETAVQASAALSEEVKEMTELWKRSAAEAFEANCRGEKLKEELRGAQERTKERQATVRRLEEEARTEGDALRAAQNEAKSLSAELGRVELRLVEAEARAQEKEAEEESLRAAMREAGERVEGTELELSVAQERTQQLVQDCEALRTRCASSDSQLRMREADMQALAEQLRAGLARSVEELGGLGMEIAAAMESEEIGGMRAELSRLQLEERCTKLAKELEAAEAAARSATEGGSGLEEQLQLVEAQRSELQEQVREVEERVQAIASEKEALEEQVAALEAERGGLVQEAAKARREVEAARQELEEERGDWEQEKAALEEEAAKNGGRWEEADKTARRLEEELRCGEAAAGELRAALEEAKSRERAKEEREAAMRQELKGAAEQREDLDAQRQKEGARAASEVKELSRRLEAAEQERERRERAEGLLRKELEAAEGQRRAAEAALARAEGEAAHRGGVMKGLGQEREELAERVRELGEAVSEGRRRVGELERALEESEGRRRAAERSVGAASEGAEERAAALLAEVEAAQREAGKAQTEKGYLQERVQGLKAAGEDARRAVGEREAELAEVMLERTALQLAVMDLRGAVEGRDAAVKCLEAATARRDAKLQEVEAGLRSSEAKVVEQERQLEEAGRGAAGLGERVEALEGELQEAKGEVEKREEEARTQAERMEAEKEALREEIRTQERTLEEEKTRAEELSREVAREVEGRESLEEEHRGLGHKAEELAAEAAQRAEEAAAAEKGQAEARAKSEQLRSYLEEERGEREKQEGVMEEMRVVLEQAEGELQRREESATASALRAAELEAALAEAQATGAGLQEQLAAGQRALEEVRAALAAAETRAEEAEEEVVTVQTRLGEVEKAVEVLFREGEALKVELAAEAARSGELSAGLTAREAELAEERERGEKARVEAAEALERLAGEVTEWRSKAGKAKTLGEGLAVRLQEAEEEGQRTSSRLAEIDEVLQGKGREVAKLHGRLAEEQALVAEADERAAILRGNEEKLRGEVAAREKQLKRLNAMLEAVSDGRGIDWGGEEADQLREELAKEREARKREGEERETELKGLQAMLLQSQLRAVDDKLAADDGQWNGKASPGSHRGGGKPEDADARSKASTEPTETPERDEGQRQGRGQDEEEAMNPLDSAGKAEYGRKDGGGLREELERVRAALKEAEARCEALKRRQAAGSEGEDALDDEDELERSGCLEAGEGRELACGALRRLVRERVKARMAGGAFAALEANWAQGRERREGVVHLLVKCQRSVRRRAAAKEREEAERKRAVESAGAERLGLQRELVEKTDALLASEKKFAHLLSWVQKNKAKPSP